MGHSELSQFQIKASFHNDSGTFPISPGTNTNYLILSACHCDLYFMVHGFALYLQPCFMCNILALFLK